MTQIEFQLQQAGFCYSSEHHALQGGPKRPIKFPATYGILRHPSEGIILFDTGYTDRFLAETARFPASIYAKLTPVTIPREEEAAQTLIQMGIAPEAVEHIIISHFHADHIGGLRDFPNATFYCSQAAWEQLERLNGIRATSKAILKGLLPDDFMARLQLIDVGFCQTTQDPQLGTLWDLWGDGSIRLAALPGHAAGQLGALLNTPQGEIFLIADASWLIETVETGTLPHPIVRILFSSWTRFKESLQKVRAYAQAHPDTLIVPCHCEQTRQALMDRLEV